MTDSGVRVGELGPGDPGYEFPKEVHNLLVSAETANLGLSAMADSKASMLMGASFVVFSISIGEIADGQPSLPVLLLTLFSFAATVLGILTVRPGLMSRSKVPTLPQDVNILFFNSYTNIERDEYVDQVIKTLSSEEETYRAMARDIYDHGSLLRRDKYLWLYWSFTLFLIGLIITFVAAAYQVAYADNEATPTRHVAAPAVTSPD